MKVVIVGLGKVGRSILESLCEERHEIVAIDKDRAVVEDVVNQFDVMGMTGDGTAVEKLSAAGVEKADLFIAVTASDEINMLSCFVAKRMGASNTVARIRGAEHDSKSLAFLKRELGLSMIINPELLTAQVLSDTLQLPSATRVEYFTSRLFVWFDLEVRSGSVADGVSLLELRKKTPAKFLVCAVRRGDKVFIPNGTAKILAGDKIGIICAHYDVYRVLKTMGFVGRQVKDVMIVGAGMPAIYLARHLVASNVAVKLVEKEEARCLEASEQLSDRVVIIHGNGMSQELLAEEGLQSTDAFVALTGKDEENILMSFYAKSQNGGKVIAKVNSNELSTMAEKIGMESVISPKDLVADVLVRYARALEKSIDSEIETLYSVMNGGAEALEFKVLADFAYANVPLKDLHFKNNVLIAGINRAGTCIVPGGDDVILPDDLVIVVTENEGMHALSEAFLQK